jgi:tryptophan synthase beta chain
VEAGGRGEGLGNNAVRMNDSGKTGIVQGYKSYFLLDEDGQVLPTHSISAGLDYPGIGPQLAELGKRGRIEFQKATDNEALEALKFFAKNEGLIFAMESAHAAAAAIKLAKEMEPGRNIIVNMSGRGDKDIFISAAVLDSTNWKEFLLEESRRIDAQS